MADLALDRLGPAALTLLRAVVAAAGRSVAPLLVGGAVRDAWLGAPRASAAVDLDVAVPRGALALARRLAKRLGGAFVPLDVARGAARVVAGEFRVDVTDFRAPTVEGDLAARDFTVDALAVDVRRLLAAGRAPLIDPTGGLADLRARRLRPPAPRVLAEDPLRALRGVRLEATLGLTLTPAAARAIRGVAPGLAGVAAERVRDELLLVLGLANGARALRRLERLGLLDAIVPEVGPMRTTFQPPPHRFTVLEHSLRAVDAADALLRRLDALGPVADELAAHLAEPLGGSADRRHALKLAALLHDVAKPETRREIEGRVRFFEHDTVGAARARAIGERLRLPERMTAVVERLVRHHLRPMHLVAAGAVSRRARYRFFRDLGGESRDLLLLALVDAAAVRGESPLRAWRRSALIRDLLAGWQEQHATAAAPPLVRGEDVMRHFGIGPGPEVGRLLERAREAQALGLVGTMEDALAYLDSSCGAP